MPPAERKPGGNVRSQRCQKSTPEGLVAALEVRCARTDRVPPITSPEALLVSARRNGIAQAITAN